MTSPASRLDRTSPPSPAAAPTTSRALSRRTFLKRPASPARGGHRRRGQLFTQLAFGATPYTGDVLVVLSLRGGIGRPERRSSRPATPTTRPGGPTSASRRATLFQLDPMFGMHPAMAPLKPFWDAGMFGVVHAVGMARAEPLALRGDGGDGARRAGDVAPHRLDRPRARPAGAGHGVPGACRSAAESPRPRSSGPTPSSRCGRWTASSSTGRRTRRRLAAWDAALRGLHAGARRHAAGPASRRAGRPRRRHRAEGPGYTPANGAVYPARTSATRCKDIARLIKADVGLQVAAVDYGDWDMHAGMGTLARGGCTTTSPSSPRSLSAFATTWAARRRRRDARHAHRVRPPRRGERLGRRATTATGRRC